MFIALVEIITILFGGIVIGPLNFQRHAEIDKYDDGFCRAIGPVQPERRLNYHRVTMPVEFTQEKPEIVNGTIVFVDPIALVLVNPPDVIPTLTSTNFYVVETLHLSSEQFFPCHAKLDGNPEAVHMNIWIDYWIFVFILSLSSILTTCGCVGKKAASD